MSNTDDVLSFLQEVDTLAKKTDNIKPVAPIDDVLSFLNEIDAPKAHESLASPKKVQSTLVSQPSVLHSKAAAKQPSPQPIKQQPSPQPTLKPVGPSATSQSAPIPPVTTESSSGWSWDAIGSTLWGQAQAATSKTADTLTKSLETARHFAGETAKSFNVDEQVKKVMAAVPTQPLAHLDLGQITSTIVDTIAPPIQRPENAFFQDKVHVWFCMQVTMEEKENSFLQFFRTTAFDYWVDDPSHQITQHVAPHLVNDPSPQLSMGLEQAMAQSQKILQRMVKLIDPNEPQDAQIYVIVCPFETVIPTIDVAQQTQRQYLASIMRFDSEGNNHCVTRVSQSFPVVTQNTELDKYLLSRRHTILEAVLHDLCVSFGWLCIHQQ